MRHDCFALPGWDADPTVQTAAVAQTRFQLPDWDSLQTPSRLPSFSQHAVLRSSGLAIAAVAITSVSAYVAPAPSGAATETTPAAPDHNPVASVVAVDVPETTAPEQATVRFDTASIDVDQWRKVSYTRYANADGTKLFASPGGQDSTSSLSAGARITIDRTALDGQWSRISGEGWVATKNISSSDPTYVPPAQTPKPASASAAAAPGSPNTSTAAPTPQQRSFTNHVYTSGAGTSQSKVDACQGAVWTTFNSGVSIAEHNHCGGAWVLKLRKGDKVTLTGVGAGTYTVVGSRDVSKGSNSSVLGGKTWLQTCYFNSDTMRLVQIVKA